jgi:hypothetical protein
MPANIASDGRRFSARNVAPGAEKQEKMRENIFFCTAMAEEMRFWHVIC